MLLQGKRVEVLLELTRDGVSSVSFDGSSVLLRVRRLKDGYPLLYSWVRKRASLAIRQRVWAQARRMGLVLENVRIGDQRSRWGSCSSSGRLSFSFRVWMAPQEVLDYVVIHELAHLKVRDHSGKFWNEVARVCPDYERQRRWLRENGRFLQIPRPVLN
jgi:predicted metal-dependent hydrolase